MNVTAWILAGALTVALAMLGWQMWTKDGLEAEVDLWKDDAAYHSDRADALEDRARGAEAELASTQAAYARARANRAAAQLRLGRYEAIIQKIEERDDADTPVDPAIADALDGLLRARSAPPGGGDGNEAGGAPGPR